MKYHFYEPEKDDWVRLIGAQRGGSDIAYFNGKRFQRGGSLGSIISTLWRSVPKFLNSTVGKAVLGGLSGIASDVKEGVPLKDAAKKHSRAQLKGLTGLGRRKKRQAKPQKRQFFI